MEPGPPPNPERPPEDHRAFPDARPLRRMQGVTFALIALVALVTLLSDSRPAEVRWATLAGVAVLVAAVAVVLRRRRGERPPP